MAIAIGYSPNNVIDIIVGGFLTPAPKAVSHFNHVYTNLVNTIAQAIVCFYEKAMPSTSKSVSFEIKRIHLSNCSSETNSSALCACRHTEPMNLSRKNS